MTNRVEGIMEWQSCLNASSFKIQYTFHPTAGLQKERGERGAAFLSGMLHCGPGRTLLEMEVGVVFNPYLEQLSLQTTKPFWIRRIKKEKSLSGGCSQKHTSRDAS